MEAAGKLITAETLVPNRAALYMWIYKYVSKRVSTVTRALCQVTMQLWYELQNPVHLMAEGKTDLLNMFVVFIVRNLSFSFIFV